MFHEWVTSGAAFGISAFFAIVTFGAFVFAVVGLVMFAGKILGVEDDKDNRHKRS
jgi:hypothetical protein